MAFLRGGGLRAEEVSGRHVPDGHSVEPASIASSSHNPEQLEVVMHECPGRSCAEPSHISRSVHNVPNRLEALFVIEFVAKLLLALSFCEKGDSVKVNVSSQYIPICSKNASATGTSTRA